jgi:hypothetical protein
MLQIDWKTYLAARKDKTTGNKDTSVFTEAWSPEKSIDLRFQTLTTDPDLVPFATDSNKKVLVLHSFKNAGGTLLRPENKTMCLLGTGSLATALEVNHLTLMADCNLVTPTIDAFRKCTTASEVTEVEAPNENGLVTYPGSATFLPAPWLAEAVIAANSSDPFFLITIVNAAATAFDEVHEEDEEYITSAEDHAGDFLLWSWAVGAGRVSTTSCIFDPTDIDLESFRIERHQACIIPSGGVTWAAITGGLPPPPAADITNTATAVLGLLNTTLLRQADKQEEQNTILMNQLQHMIKKEGLIKNRFKNLHKSITKMIIFTSAVDNKDILDKPVQSFKRIINSKTVALAEQELNTQFESHGLNEVSFSQGYMVNIYSGNLLWASSDTPSNHSPFSFAEVEPLRADKQKNRHISLQLILTQGRGMTVDKIKASNKQEVHPPMNFHELKEQLNMFLVATKIFFGELSIGSQRNMQWSRISSPMAKSACSQTKLGQELSQENITTRDPNGMKNASAALVGSSRSTVSPTAKTQRVTWKQKKSRPLSSNKCYRG